MASYFRDSMMRELGGGGGGGAGGATSLLEAMMIRELCRGGGGGGGAGGGGGMDAAMAALQRTTGADARLEAIKTLADEVRKAGGIDSMSAAGYELSSTALELLGHTLPPADDDLEAVVATVRKHNGLHAGDNITILGIGSGLASTEALLNALTGVTVIATDGAPPKKGTYMDVQALTADQALEKYGGKVHAVFGSWLPLDLESHKRSGWDSGLGAAALKCLHAHAASGGSTIKPLYIHIGELQGGCTNTDAFFDLLWEQWEEVMCSYHQSLLGGMVRKNEHLCVYTIKGDDDEDDSDDDDA